MTNRIKRGKKSQANILVVLILIVLVLIIFTVLWNIVLALIKKNIQTTEIRAQLVGMKMNIDKIVEVPEEAGQPSKINLTLHRGPERTVLINRTVVKKHAEIVFILDSTGSMSEDINAAKNTMNNFTDRLNASNVSYRLALVEFKDYPTPSCGDTSDFSYKIHNFSGNEFTSNVTLYKNEISTIVASGGNDEPESDLTALNQSINLDYKKVAFPDIVLKFMVLITDSKMHARDCTCGKSIFMFNDCNETIDPRYGILTNNTYFSCYKGPEYIEDIEKKLVDENITLYYVNRPSATCNNSKDISMSTATNGGFYDYTQSAQVSTIINRLSDEIIEVFASEQKWDHLKIVFHTDYGTFAQKQYEAPLPLETKCYEIIVPDEVKNIDDINQIDIYMAVYTKTGQEILSPLLDTYRFKK